MRTPGFSHVKFTPQGASPQAEKEAPYERHLPPLIWLSDLRPALSLRAHGGARVMLDLTLGGIISAGLLVYLVWAMLRPEDF
jgi:K+-transporting ATPase KdpF subunit